jgi:hypothetical protein
MQRQYCRVGGHNFHFPSRDGIAEQVTHHLPLSVKRRYCRASDTPPSTFRQETVLQSRETHLPPSIQRRYCRVGDTPSNFHANAVLQSKRRVGDTPPPSIQRTVLQSCWHIVQLPCREISNKRYCRVRVRPSALHAHLNNAKTNELYGTAEQETHLPPFMQRWYCRVNRTTSIVHVQVQSHRIYGIAEYATHLP